ncbi:MAG: DUF2079 domain-containing protein [Acidobacteriota bacterium]
MTSPAAERQPRLLFLLFGGASLLAAAFICTAPWTIGRITVARLTPALIPLYLTLVTALMIPRWRRYLARLPASCHRKPIALATLFVGSSAFALRVVASQFRSLSVNGWDFSSFDLPIQRSLVSTFLDSPIDHRSFLGTHASYILTLFIPLHALHQTPAWLLVTEALAISAATAASWLLFRDLLHDDTAAMLLSLAYLLNTYTAKTLQYVFHVEVLYPPLLFLLARFLRRRQPMLIAAVTLLLLSVKEDAVIPLLGISIALFLLRPREWRTPALLVSGGIVVYLLSTRIVMPRAAGVPAGHPWYATYWAAYGPTPLLAARGMFLHPLQVFHALWSSGIRDLLEPLLFLPLLGGLWLLAAIPALTVYGTASNPGISHFAIYYSAPLLPLLFLAAAVGARRLARRLRRPGLTRLDWQRLIAFAVLGASALDGASYVFRRPNPRRLDVATMVALRGPGRLRVQGSLLPHSGYKLTTLPLDTLTSNDAVLLDDSSDPYPFTREQIRSFSAALEKRGYHRAFSRHGLVLLVPSRE